MNEAKKMKTSKTKLNPELQKVIRKEVAEYIKAKAGVSRNG